MLTVRGSKIAQMRRVGRLPGLGSGVKRVQDMILAFSSSLESVEQNRDFNSEAKERMTKAILGQVQKARSVALMELTNEWQALRREYARLEKKQTSVRESAAQSWDYQRMAYEAQKVHQFIETANGNSMTGLTPLGAIHQAYETAQNSGDRVVQRVWAENMPGLLDTRFGSGSLEERMTVADLERQAAKDYERITTTSEMIALQDEAAALVVRTNDLSALTEEVRRFFDGSNQGFPQPSDFDHLEDGISLRAMYSSKTMDFENSLEMK